MVSLAVFLVLAVDKGLNRPVLPPLRLGMHYDAVINSLRGDDRFMSVSGPFKTVIVPRRKVFLTFDENLLLIRIRLFDGSVVFQGNRQGIMSLYNGGWRDVASPAKCPAPQAFREKG